MRACSDDPAQTANPSPWPPPLACIYFWSRRVGSRLLGSNGYNREQSSIDPSGTARHPFWNIFMDSFRRLRHSTILTVSHVNREADGLPGVYMYWINMFVPAASRRKDRARQTLERGAHTTKSLSFMLNTGRVLCMGRKEDRSWNSQSCCHRARKRIDMARRWHGNVAKKSRPAKSPLPTPGFPVNRTIVIQKSYIDIDK